MPELHFKGKEFVYNHHLTVPFRPLIPDPKKSIGDDPENLIIHGDNLHALKALLPHYAGKIDCIFIDPPYNTGNENWAYNDNVNSPFIKEWLDKVVDRDDLLRHDKWLCMMYPRLKLLHELLAESGSFWMTLDDNEVHRGRAIMDEIFGEENFVAIAIWQKVYAPKSSANYFSEDHDYIIVYAKNKENWSPELLPRTAEQDAVYQNSDNDPRGLWRPNNLAARNYYSKGTYSIKCPGGRLIEGPPQGSYWRVSEDKFRKLDADGRIWWGEKGNNIPAPKIFLSEVKAGRVPQTLWLYKDVGHTQEAKKELVRIMNFQDSEDVFITPKPVRLIERILHLATGQDAIILDSFAGSGTTAHAVLLQNEKDGGNRKFILVECESYANELTAERVRRVIEGYKYQGTKKEELLRENITWTKFKKAEQLLHDIEGIENLERTRFDRIKKEIKDGELIVNGENDIEERVEGLGGGFTYCTLGDPLDLDGMLTGKNLPSYADLGGWLFHTATGHPLDKKGVDKKSWYLGETEAYFVWLIYKPNLKFLKSRDAVLTLTEAETISQARTGKRHLVFAPGRYVPNKLLHPLGVEYAPLPFALYRVERD